MTDEKPEEARRGREEEWGAGEMNAADTKAQLKKLEVFVSGRSVYTWDTDRVDDYRWQEYWNSLDEWPREIDSEAALGGAK